MMSRALLRCARCVRSLSTTLVGVEPVRGTLRPARAAAVAASSAGAPPSASALCGPLPSDDAAAAEADAVPMVDPASGEWGGPTKGGKRPEPTRFGDWERSGRCSDF